MSRLESHLKSHLKLHLNLIWNQIWELRKSRLNKAQYKQKIIEVQRNGSTFEHYFDA
jgi:hypothetical protein